MNVAVLEMSKSERGERCVFPGCLIKTLERSVCECVCARVAEQRVLNMGLHAQRTWIRVVVQHEICARVAS